MEWYKLKAAGVKESAIEKLMNRLDSYEDIFKLDKDQLRFYFQFDDETIEAIYSSKNINLENEIKKYEKQGINIISLKNEYYPEKLKNISHPPLFLYYRGDLSLTEKKTIGVVGTRRPTVYGRNVCEKIIDELVNAGVVTVSGLASGIDTVCHKRTIEKKGKTIAVVGSGLDVIYPAENKNYWKIIGEEGLLVSEYPLGTPPNNFNFPRRNRIIAGLSRGVAVIESKEKGGSLITASLALEEGREVFAVPGDIYSPASAGTNELIKKSEAKLITSGKDILDEYGWESGKEKESEPDIVLSEDERVIYNILTVEKSLDELITESGMRAKNLLALLMEMEINGIVSSISGGKYRRKK